LLPYTPLFRSEPAVREHERDAQRVCAVGHAARFGGGPAQPAGHQAVLSATRADGMEEGQVERDPVGWEGAGTDDECLVCCVREPSNTRFSGDVQWTARVSEVSRPVQHKGLRSVQLVQLFIIVSSDVDTLSQAGHFKLSSWTGENGKCPTQLGR